MLKATDLSFRYHQTGPWIVQGASLELKPGEILGLSGPSGRGKTTLGRLLAGYLTPQAGSVTLDGVPLPRRGYCPTQLIFQHPELAINPRWRIGKVLTEGYSPSPQTLNDLHLEESWFNRWPHELSGGELQRVAVARALNPQTRYLIADEMTAMLDAITQAQIWQAILSRVRADKLGMLVISHEAALLAQICHRVIDTTVLESRL